MKSWWDPELDTLKSQAILSHKLWLEGGKPRFGSLYSKRTQDKLLYKNATNQRKIEEKLRVSSDLHDSLLNKKSGVFWKTWKSKVCGKTQSNKMVINGSSDDTVIANLFKDYFQMACTNNSSNFTEKAKLDFESRWPQYMQERVGRRMNKDLINTEIVGLAVANLNAGKSSGL